MTPEALNRWWWLALAAYFMGSVPFGYLIARQAGLRDIRTHGSGNIGATNVARVLGKGAGAATLLLDAAKGFLAVWLAATVTGWSAAWMIVAAIGAVLGHTYPLWLGGRGGRGVATAAGALLLLCWPAVLAAIAIWGVVLAAWRYVSLASVVAAAALPIFTYILYAPGHAPSRVVSIGTTLISLLIILRHRANIERLVAGTEARFGAE
ncbi:MAG TPA: glycerol-3-phosphate 1-O-acyltransferase PlsY [Candidatus Acidoferrales bacterium]|nr:glycerol-3-phosphate 1-O-acyltransferase PlsY [Candidatus Acidoferrales bacterium]